MKLKDLHSVHERRVVDVTSRDVEPFLHAGIRQAIAHGLIDLADETEGIVALSGGIDETTGKIDDGMVKHVRAARDYLEDKHAQPILLVEIDHFQKDHRQDIMLQGFAATLAPTGPLLGAIDLLGVRSAGVSVIDGYSPMRFSAELMNNGSWGQILEFRPDGQLPLSTDLLTVGKLCGPLDSGLGKVSQELLAGKDIMPWIIETFGTGNVGYDFYMQLVSIFTREIAFEPTSLAYFVQSPFFNRAHKEYLELHSRNVQQRPVPSASLNKFVTIPSSHPVQSFELQTQASISLQRLVRVAAGQIDF